MGVGSMTNKIQWDMDFWILFFSFFSFHLRQNKQREGREKGERGRKREEEGREGERREKNKSNKGVLEGPQATASCGSDVIVKSSHPEGTAPRKKAPPPAGKWS